MIRIWRGCVYAPYWTIGIIVSITIFFGYYIPKMEIDPRIELLFSEDNPVRKAYVENLDNFESGEESIVGIISDNIFTRDCLKKIHDISSEIEAIPNVDEVTNILMTEHIGGDEFGLTVSPMYQEGAYPQTDEEIAVFKERVNSWEFLKGALITEDGKGTVISFELVEGWDSTDMIPVYYAVKDIVTKYQGNDDIFITGAPVVDGLMEDYMLKDLRFLIPIVTLIIVVVLFLCFRNVRGVVLPLLTVAMSCVWTLGLMALLEIPLTIVTSAMPVIIIAVGSAYGIHVLENIFTDAAEGKGGKEGIVNAVARVSLPVTMAGLTTMGGFASLSTSEVAPIGQAGLLEAFGTGAALLLSLTFIPAVLSMLEGMGKEFIPQYYSKRDRTGPQLNMYSRMALRKSWLVVSVGLCLLAVSLIAAGQVRNDMDPIGYFQKRCPIRIADSAINSKFGGSSIFNVVVKGTRPDEAKSPEFVRHIDELQNRLNRVAGVGKTASVVDLIKKMNQEMHGGHSAFYTIPESRELVAQYLLLYSFSGGEELGRFLNDDYQDGQIILQTKSLSKALTERISNAIKDYEENELRESKVSIVATGISALSLQINNLIVKGQIESLIASLGFVMLMTSIIFRSLRLGFFSVLPLVIPLGLNFGVMGATGITLNAATAMIASVAIGIGVDYSIHFLSRFRYERKKGVDLERALDTSIKTSGRGILYNAMAVSAGFLVFVPSRFVPLAHTGFLVALVMLTSAVATLTILPAALKILGFKKRSRAEEAAILMGRVREA